MEFGKFEWVLAAQTTFSVKVLVISIQNLHNKIEKIHILIQYVVLRKADKGKPGFCVTVRCDDRHW